MSFIITGASGQLGRQAAEDALKRIDPSELILVTRTPAALASFAQRGASVRHGDFDDPGALRAAFAGGRRLLLISAKTIGARVAQHRTAIDVAAEVGVEFVAYTSFTNADRNSSAIGPEHLDTETALRESAMRWCFLRNSLYSDRLQELGTGAASSGRFVTNRGLGLHAYVARSDCAAAAAAVLTGDGHDGLVYEITGPELIGASDSATIFAELGGRHVEVVQLNDAEFARHAAEQAGVPLDAGRMLATFGHAIRTGELDALSDDVELLTGLVPKSVRSVLHATWPSDSLGR